MNQLMNPSLTTMHMVFKMNMLEPALRLPKILMERRFQATIPFNFQTEGDKMSNIQLITMLVISLMYRMKDMP